MSAELEPVGTVVTIPFGDNRAIYAEVVRNHASDSEDPRTCGRCGRALRYSPIARDVVSGYLIHYFTRETVDPETGQSSHRPADCAEYRP